MDDNKTIIHSINWDFINAPISNNIHSIHPYPAKFIPEIPRKLIEIYAPQDNSIILDPFCGCGTTLIEAILQGYNSYGIDINPIACLTAKVKTTPIHGDFDSIINSVVYKAKVNYENNIINIPNIPNLNHWFKPDIQRSLAAIIDEINKVDNTTYKDALKVAFSSIVVQVSNQDSDTRYAAIEKKIISNDVFNRFEKSAKFIKKSSSSLSDKLLIKLGTATILNKDILSIAPSELPNNVGLVITSPPYPNAYEYWLYHKYRMYWLGMDPISVRKNEIGARCHYFNSNHYGIDEFSRQMDQTFKLLSQIMLPHAKACFIIGRSIIHGETIDNVEILKNAASNHGFTTNDLVERTISAKRKTFNPSHGKINKEHLIVFSLDV